MFRLKRPDFPELSSGELCVPKFDVQSGTVTLFSRVGLRQLDHSLKAQVKRKGCRPCRREL